MDTRTRELMHSPTVEGSDNAAWETPPEVWAALHREFKFTIDLTGGPGTQHRLGKWIGPGSPLLLDDLAKVDLTAPFSDAVGPGPGFSNPPYGDFISKAAMPFALRALAAGMTTVWLLPLRVTKVFKATIFTQASEIRLVDRRITFYENGEPRWNRRIYNASLALWLIREGHTQYLVENAMRIAKEEKALLPAIIKRDGGMYGTWPSQAAMHAAATKRPDPAPFDSIVVVFDPKKKPGLFGATWKLWSWETSK